jgi:hypothetical protein
MGHAATRLDGTGLHAERVPRPVPPTASTVNLPGGWLEVTRSTRGDAPVVAKLNAGQREVELSNDLLVGARLMERVGAGTPSKLRDLLLNAAIN